MPTATVLAAASSTTDDVTAWATIALAAITFLTLLATIYFATAERRRTTKAEAVRQLAQARLIVTGGPGTGPFGRREDGYHCNLTFPFANHSDRPVLDVRVEAWASAEPLDHPPTWALQTKIVLPGTDGPWVLDIATETPDLSLRAWRVRWTDADGQQWFRDQLHQQAPERFADKPPRPYPG
jgi:hypothetical protein